MISTASCDKTFVLSAATNYSYSFKVFDPSELRVEWTVDGEYVPTVLTEGLHYNVSGVGEDTGSVTLLLISGAQWWGNGDSLYVSRHTAILQETQFKNIREFLASVHENAFDRGIAILQEFQRDVLQQRPITDILGLQDALDQKLNVSALTTFGYEIVQCEDASALATLLLLGSAAFQDSSAFAASVHYHDETYSQLGHNHNSLYSLLAHSHDADDLNFDNQLHNYWSGDQNSNTIGGAMEYLSTTKMETTNPSYGGVLAGPLSGMTDEGGFYISLLAGETLARGEVVYIKDTGGTDGKVWKCPTSNDKPIGIVYANASANASVKIITNGIAYTLPESGITAVRGNVMLTSTTAAGRVAQSASPNTTEHWRECGHFLDTGSGNGALTRAVLHFN